VSRCSYSGIVLYCIYIFINCLLQCTPIRSASSARDPEKRAVLRERKEALGSPVNIVDRVEGRSWFQSEGPITAKARVCNQNNPEGLKYIKYTLVVSACSWKQEVCDANVFCYRTVCMTELEVRMAHDGHGRIRALSNGY